MSRMSQSFNDKFKPSPKSYKVKYKMGLLDFGLSQISLKVGLKVLKSHESQDLMILNEIVNNLICTYICISSKCDKKGCLPKKVW